MLRNLSRILDKYEPQFGLTTSTSHFELFHGLHFYDFQKRNGYNYLPRLTNDL
jgi:hypothetical protein